MPKYTKKYTKKDGTERIFTRNYDYREKYNKKTKCDCGGSYSTLSRAKHFKTKKHRKFLGLEPIEKKKKECFTCGSNVINYKAHMKSQKHFDHIILFNNHINSGGKYEDW
jgi:hypothetical protein